MNIKRKIKNVARLSDLLSKKKKEVRGLVKFFSLRSRKEEKRNIFSQK